MCHTVCVGVQDAKTVAAWATDGWTHTGRVIEASSVAKKPSDEDFGALLGPISAAIGASMDPPRRDANFDYIKGFNEVLQTLAWVTMPGGVDYIQSQIDASSLYVCAEIGSCFVLLVCVYVCV